MATQHFRPDPSAAAKLPTPRLINLTIDPQELEPLTLAYLHTWVVSDIYRIISAFQVSLHEEPPIPMGAQLAHVPTASGG